MAERGGEEGEINREGEVKATWEEDEERGNIHDGISLFSRCGRELKHASNFIRRLPRDIVPKHHHPVRAP